ncbi:hypothetical protein Clacol_007111 [Clathrus columnatus]|uniref:Uncharacterized protein n=1 Tax=Clathrus columnatus TaxID=1419009 RepID=A0AAV5ALR3_9AGAM|nr:hypothetical protein Clacol_007111 [Clathrus columnatus]
MPATLGLKRKPRQKPAPYNHIPQKPKANLPKTSEDLKAWDIIQEFATSDMTLPCAEGCLCKYLGDRYIEGEWTEAFKAVMDAENNSVLALEAIERLTTAVTATPSVHPPSISSNNTSQHDWPLQIQELEKDLQQVVNELKWRNQIVGQLLTLEEMLNLVEETDVGGCDLLTDEKIVQKVKYKMSVEQGEIMELDSESEGEVEEETEDKLTIPEVLTLCEQVECLCLRYVSNPSEEGGDNEVKTDGVGSMVREELVRIANICHIFSRYTVLHK